MKINNEIANQEFKKWLDSKRIKKVKIKEALTQQEIIVEAIEEGDLIIKEDFTMEYSLAFPLQSDDGEMMLDKLVFKHRMRKEDFDKKYRGLKGTDADGRLSATIAALTGQNTNLIGKLDSIDAEVCTSIAVYFL